MDKKFREWAAGLKPLTDWDIILYGIIAVLCYFSFQHSDLLLTGSSSITLLQGHIPDFYDVKDGMVNNYLLSTYILFALWNLPLYLLHIVTGPSMDVGFAIFWYKALPLVFFAASALVLTKIGLTAGLSGRDSKLMTAFWASSPLLFYSQFIFGQYDIFTVFFVLLGLLYYMKKNMDLFIIFFAVSMTFKYFPLFIFAPLLLLAEKRPLYIIRAFVILAVPFAAETLPYLGSQGFMSTAMSFSVAGRIFSAGFQADPSVSASVFIIAFFFICSLAYMKEPRDDKELFHWAVYTAMFSSCFMFAFMMWHPQWLIIATPFLAIMTFMDKKPEFFILFDMLVMVPFVAFTVIHYQANADQALLSSGIFGSLRRDLTDPMTTIFMKKFFVLGDASIFYSMVSAYFLINVIFRFPGGRFDAWQENFSPAAVEGSWNSVRVRFFAGVMIFIVPALLSFTLPTGRTLLYDMPKVSGLTAQNSLALIKGRSAGQVFRAGCSELKELVVAVAQNSATDASLVNFTISEYPGAKVIFSESINASELKSRYFYLIDLGGLKVSPEKEYAFSFDCPDGTITNSLSLVRTLSKAARNDSSALINNKPEDFDLFFKLYGKK
jgi:hypothetical protein